MKSHSGLNLVVIGASVFVINTIQFATQASASPREMKESYSASKPKNFKGWGTAIDPDGDCKFFLSEQSLLINVPGWPHPHDLAAEVDVINAPRVLQTVKGDFTVEVQVDGRFAPGQNSTLPGRVGYNGAGLVVMADAQNVVCLARAVMNHEGNEPAPYANFEMRMGGELERIGDAHVKPLPESGPVFLRLERHGQKISGAVSLDGKEWDQLTPKELPMDWPKKLSVGVVAISTSAEEFDPRFSKFKILK